MSDDDDDDDDDIMLTDEKYRPQSLEKMIALIAMLVEKSRGVDKQLHVSQKDYHSVVGGKASATPTLLSVSTCSSSLLMVSSSLYVSHMYVTRVELGFQSCPSLELVSPLQVTHLPPVWDLLLPLA